MLISKFNKNNAANKKIEPNSVYITKYVNASSRRSLTPHFKITKYIGIRIVSKNKQNKNKSVEENVSTNNTLIVGKFINNERIFRAPQLATTHNGRIMPVNNKKT